MKRRVAAKILGGAILAMAVGSSVYALQAKPKNWYQGTCGQCGNKGPKMHLDYKPEDEECLRHSDGKRCGGLVKWNLCAPPG